VSDHIPIPEDRVLDAVRPSMVAVRAHEPIKLREKLVLACNAVERVGDTCAEGMDILVHRYQVGRPLLARCQARIEEVDGVACVYARSTDGEYRAQLAGAFNQEFPPPASPFSFDTDDESPEVRAAIDRLAMFSLELHAALYQRERRARDTALALPAQAGALASMSTAGRGSSRQLALAERNMPVKSAPERVAGEMRELVTVELVIDKVRAARLRLRADDVVFPEFKGRSRKELAQLVTEQLAQRCRPRVMQGVLASIAVAYRQGGIRLDDDGKLPVKFRTEVMRVMGMPSASASAAQRKLAVEAMELLLHAEFHVKPVGDKRAEFMPILTVASYLESPGAGERRAARLTVNDALMGEMREGKRLRIPEALFQIGDEDRDGVRTLAGLQLAYRLAMGTRDTSEKLALFLRRAGLWEWCGRAAAKHGAPHVLRELRRELDALRALPWVDGDERVDIAGGTVIEGEVIDKAIVVYRDTPSWARSSP
jgi:hypothetical protein